MNKNKNKRKKGKPIVEKRLSIINSCGMPCDVERGEVCPDCASYREVAFDGRRTKDYPNDVA